MYTYIYEECTPETIAMYSVNPYSYKYAQIYIYMYPFICT